MKQKIQHPSDPWTRNICTALPCTST